VNNTNNLSARASYDKAKQVLYSAWIDSFSTVPGAPTANEQAACWNWVNNRKLSQGEIRLEVELNTTNNSFVFGVTPNQVNSSNVTFITETRLNLQDSLIANEYGIFVCKPASRTDTGFLLRTYGNTQDFPTGASALDSTFYSNGSFQVKCNNDVVVPYRGLLNHWYKPQTQQTAALGAASPGDQIRGAEDGFITDEPNILLIGSKNYVPVINLVSNLAAVDANTRAVLIFRGINAQNSTVIN
jgi:hypothetical protein